MIATVERCVAAVAAALTQLLSQVDFVGEYNYGYAFVTCLANQVDPLANAQKGLLVSAVVH
jgi:hypothetical protein